jgi:DNA-binding response OmpR family regulator
MAGRILMVEDDVAFCAELKDILEADGFEVALAHDGPSGLAKALEGAYDLLMLDLKLPGLSGLEILKQVRAQGIPARVIVVTASIQTNDLPEGTVPSEADDSTTLGSADALLGKPFAVTELMDIIERLIGQP